MIGDMADHVTEPPARPFGSVLGTLVRVSD